jgi:WD40 repeat protein
LAFSPDSLWLLSGHADGTIVKYKVEKDFNAIQTEEKHTDRVNLLYFGPDGSCYASASYDETVQICDAFSFRPRKTLADHSSYVYVVRVSDDGQWLISGSDDNAAIVYCIPQWIC